ASRKISSSAISSITDLSSSAILLWNRAKAVCQEDKTEFSAQRVSPATGAGRFWSLRKGGSLKSVVIELYGI
ncbi:unnamed protein product, partial [Oikopleura dioica]